MSDRPGGAPISASSSSVLPPSASACSTLLLAAIGTYSVLSCNVAERRREIGTRMALGAERSGVIAQVVKEGLLLTSSAWC